MGETWKTSLVIGTVKCQLMSIPRIDPLDVPPPYRTRRLGCLPQSLKTADLLSCDADKTGMVYQYLCSSRLYPCFPFVHIMDLQKREQKQKYVLT